MGRKTTAPQKAALVLCGILTASLLLEAGLRVGGVLHSWGRSRRNAAASGSEGTYRILCIGESTTAGQYPAPLEEILNRARPDLRFAVIDRGVTGTDSEILLDSLEEELERYRPQMIVAMMGINDYGGHMPYDAAPRSRLEGFLRGSRLQKLLILSWRHLTVRIRIRLEGSGMPRPASAAGRPSEDPGTEGERLKSQGRMAEAEAGYRQAVVRDPSDIRSRVALGAVLRAQGKQPEAEGVLREAIRRAPQDAAAHGELAYQRWVANDLREAESLLRKVVELDPQSRAAVSGELAELARTRAEHSRRERSLMEAMRLRRERGEPVYDLELQMGALLRKQGRLKDAGELLARLAETSAKDAAWLELALTLAQDGRLREAAAAAEKAVSLGPDNDLAWSALAMVNGRLGRRKSAEDCHERAESLRLEQVKPLTVRNHRRLRETAQRRGIRLVIVQYPMRRLEPLRRIHENGRDTIFVDNEGTFQEAVRRAGYPAYFVDDFGADFGHCTELGNRLLAENIAAAILAGMTRGA